MITYWRLFYFHLHISIYIYICVCVCVCVCVCICVYTINIYVCVCIIPIVAQQVKNSTSIHEDMGLIPGLVQWIKDPVLL